MDLLKNGWVTTLDDEEGQRRYNGFLQMVNYVGIPKPVKNQGLHYTRDLDRILQEFPEVNVNSTRWGRLGAMGLAASFVQFVRSATISPPPPYSMFWEDDCMIGTSLPCAKAHLNEALSSLPESPRGVYFLSRNVYGRITHFPRRWERRGDIMFGTPAVLFSRASLEMIKEVLLAEGISDPIDIFLGSLDERCLIESFSWVGTALPENPYFMGVFGQKGWSV